MNKKVMNYLNEKKDKVANLVETKKDDATRYAEERINAVKEYMEKNGKKIKRSAAALALAGLTTLSATTMSGCEEISNIFNPDSTSKPFDDYVDPYIEPTIKTPEEIKENGITVEDVLAEFDKLAWDFNLRSYTWSIKDYDPDNWEEIVENSQTSAQFTKLTTPYGLISSGWTLPFYAICSKFDFTNNCYFLTEEEREVKLKNVYEATIYLDDVTYGHAGSSHFAIGIHKSQFEPYANITAPNKFKMSDYIEACENNNNCDFVYYDYEDSIGYEAFEITRETIENASEQELYLLYNIAKSIRSITLEQQIPTISDTIQNEDSMQAE